jgi:hypothetical protein
VLRSSCPKAFPPAPNQCFSTQPQWTCPTVKFRPVTLTSWRYAAEMPTLEAAGSLERPGQIFSLGEPSRLKIRLIWSNSLRPSNSTCSGSGANCCHSCWRIDA